MKLRSIRSQLLIWLISSVLITTLVVGFLTARLTWSGFNNVRDMGLEQIAQTVVRHDEAAPAQPPAPLPSTALADDDLDQFVSQIWDHSGQLVYSSLPMSARPCSVRDTTSSPGRAKAGVCTHRRTTGASFRWRSPPRSGASTSTHSPHGC